VSNLRATFAVVALIAVGILWIAERNLPDRAWIDTAPSRPNFTTGEVYAVKQRGGGTRYITAEQFDAREIRSRNTAIAMISVAVIVLGIIPTILLLRRRRSDQELRD